jgi:hypothetical protein
MKAISYILGIALSAAVPVQAQVNTTANVATAQDFGPVPKITLIDAKASAAGLKVDIQAVHLGFMGVQVEVLEKGTGTWISMIDGIYIKVPTELRDTSDEVEGSLNVPLLMVGSDTKYRLIVFGKTSSSDQRENVYSNLKTFDGFDNVLKPIANSIDLQFAQDSLTIATKTDDKVVLKASWQIPGAQGPVGLEATTNVQNPKVALSYAALPKDSSGGFPALDIGLYDQNGNRLQEAKIAVSVAANKPVSDKINSVKNEPTTSGRSSSTKFSWADLAKTGLGALMKYFTLL